MEPGGLIVTSAVNEAVKVWWQVSCREVKLSVSFESNNGQLMSSKCLDPNCPFFLSISLVGTALNAELKISAMTTDRLVDCSKVKPRSLPWTNSPMPARAGQPQLSKDFEKKISGCYSKKKIRENLWDKISASESPPLKFQMTLECGSLAFLLYFFSFLNFAEWI